MSARAPAAQPPAALNAIAAIVTRCAALLMMAVFWVRPLLSESGQRGPTPFNSELLSVWSESTTVALDFLLLILIIALRPWRRRGGEWFGPAGLGLLGAGVAVSSFYAADQRGALNGGSDLLICATAAWALARTLPGRGFACLLLAGTMATGATGALKCVLQGTSELQETLEYWVENEKPAWFAQGVAPDSPELVNFERRMRSRNAQGYSFHPNIAAACVAGAGVIAAGLLIASFRVPQLPLVERIAFAGGLAGVLGLSASAIHYAGSNGALVGGAAGIASIMALRILHRLLKKSPNAVLGLLLGGYLALLAGLAGYGLFKGTLPGASLAFRWEYWTTAGRVYAEAPWTGVGARNFSAGYLLHKSPAATEDIDNPHDIWLSYLVEFGPLGLAGAVLLYVAALRKPLRAYSNTDASAALPVSGTGWRIAAIGLLAIIHATWTNLELNKPGMGVLWGAEVLALWATVFWGADALLRRLTSDPAGVALVLVTVVAAMMTMLIHGVIDFALVTPAGLCVFAALAAVTGGLIPTSESTKGSVHRKTAWLGWASGAVLAAAYLWLVLLPSVAGAGVMRAIQSRTYQVGPRRSGEPLNVDPRAVLKCDPFDPEPLALLGDAQLQTGRALLAIDQQAGGELLRRALDTARVGLQTFPNRYGLLRTYALVLDALQASERPEAWEAVIARNPTNPRMRIKAAQAWAARWRQTHAPADAERAKQHFEHALQVDALRAADSPIRLQPRELEELNRGLAELASLPG